MKIKTLISLCVVSFLTCCHNNNSTNFVQQDLSHIKKDNIKEEETEIIFVNKPTQDQIKASNIIEEFQYIPLEMSDESMFAYCTDLEIYKNHIYLMDRITAEAVFIYDMNGKLVKRLGDKGGAPHEFAMLKGMAIDKNKDQLVLYDNRKRKMVYFSLLGDFIKSENVNFRFTGQFGILPSGNIVSATSKSDRNYHLNELTDYRLLYTDTTGMITRAFYKHDDNENLPIAFSSFFLHNDDNLYYPAFMNQICNVSDTSVCIKYLFDYKDFTPIDPERISDFQNYDEFSDYRYTTTWLFPLFAENNTHLFFKTNDKKEEFLTFYDKKNKNMISFKTMLFDTDFAINFSPVYSYGDYFIALADPALLISMKNYMIENKYPIPEKTKPFFEKIKEDDNSALVLFKIKDLGQVVSGESEN